MSLRDRSDAHLDLGVPLQVEQAVAEAVDLVLEHLDGILGFSAC